MRKALSLFLISLLAYLTIPSSAAALPSAIRNQQSQTSPATLSNQDVLNMLKMGLSAEIVIAKIKASVANFDTSSTALQSLKEAGVPNDVILAMVQAPAAGSPAPVVGEAAASSTGEALEMKAPDGTEIEIQLKNNVSGQEAKVGDIVDFTVVRPVQINGVTVIDKDASARARVTTAKKSGRWGKAGKLEWAMQDVQAVNGDRVPVRFSKRAVGESKGGTVAVAAVATTVLLGPVGLLWGLKKGKPAVIPAGNRYSVFIHGDTTIGVKVSVNAAKATP